MSDMVDGYLRQLDRERPLDTPCWSDQLPWSDDDTYIVAVFPERVDFIRRLSTFRAGIKRHPERSGDLATAETLLRTTIGDLKAKFQNWTPSERARRLAH